MRHESRAQVAPICARRRHQRIQPGMSKALVLKLVLALLCLVLACGDSGDSPSPSEPWNYVALGDSLAFGALASSGYVPRYADYARSDSGRPLTLTNLGVNGWTSTDLLNALRSDTLFRQAIANANLITWDIGGNDLLRARARFQNGTCGGADNQECFRQAVITFRANWDGIVREIAALRSGNSTALRTFDLYYPFVAQDKASGVFQTLSAYLEQVNAHIHAGAAANSYRVGRVFEAYNGSSGEEDPVAKGLISIDGFHPNDEGHKAIADQLRLLGYAPLL